MKTGNRLRLHEVFSSRGVVRTLSLVPELPLSGAQPMNLLKYMSVIAVVCLIVPTARPEDKPDYAKLIVGKWEVTKADPGTVPEGAIIEFTKDGMLKASVKKGDNTNTIEGTYTL